MTIKITGLELRKGKCEHMQDEKKELYYMYNLEGKLKVKVTERNISANTEFDIMNVSDELKRKLVEVLDEIQDELNGVKREFVGMNSYGRPVYKEKEVEAKKEQLHKDEFVIPESDVDLFHLLTKFGYTVNSIKEIASTSDTNAPVALFIKALKRINKELDK